MVDKRSSGALYPYDDLDKNELEPTWNKLDEALNDERATNIAISAPYDTGKSSFLLSYFTNRYEEDLRRKSHCFLYRWLHRFHKNQDLLSKARLDRKVEKTNFKFINLPNFFLDVKDKKESEIELEKDIISQLLFSSKPRKYPDSRIKRLKQYSIWEILFFFALFALFSVSTYLFKQDITNIEIPLISFRVIFQFVSMLTGLAILFFIFYIAFHGLPKIGWDISTKILNTKLDAKFNTDSKENDKDLFLLYGDELRYYFEKSKVRYLIFEDLDRYNNPLIFQRLRQLNINLNHGEKDRIVFIYTLKDSVFDDLRTINNELEPVIKKVKFFDYIIPMVPLSSTQNSITRFKEEINDKSNLQVNNEKLDSKFYSVQEKYLWGLGAFILDVRTIVQICSELSYYADLFKARLDREEVNINKLLGMIVYKNVYPRDYEKLLSSDSFLNQLFLEVNKQKEINREERKNEIRKIDNEIRDVGKKLQHFRNDKEVDLYVYYDKFVNNIGIYDNEKYRPNLYYQGKFWDKFFKDTSEEKKKIQKLFGWSDKLTEMIKERREAIFDRTESESYSRLKNQRNGYYEKRKLLQNKIENETFFDILNEDYEDSEYKALSNIKKLPILNYLLTSGLIDKNYYEYISPSFTNDLTPQDLNFVRNILSRTYDKGKNLENIPRIIEVLNSSNADYRYVQSTKILSYLLVQPITHNMMQHVRTIIYFWGNGNSLDLNFIGDCINNLKMNLTENERTRESKRSGIKVLVSALVSEYPEYFRIFYGGNDINFIKKNSYIFEMFFDPASEQVISEEFISNKELFDVFVEYGVFKNIVFDRLLMNWKDNSCMNLFDAGVYKFSNLSQIFSGDLTPNNVAQISFLIRNGDYSTNIDNFKLIVRAVGGLTTLIEKEKDLWEIDDSYIVKCLPSFLQGENVNYENLLTSAKFAKGLYGNQQKINLIQTLINFTKRARKQNKISLDEYNEILDVLKNEEK